MAKIKTTPRSKSHDHPYKPRKINRHAFNQVYWPYLPVILIAGLLLSLGTRQGNLQTAAKNPAGSVLSYASSMEQAHLLDETNIERTNAGLKPLKLNGQLDLAAQAKAQDMASRNYWSHSTPEGHEPWKFVADQNYAYQKLGENLAAGFDDEDSAVSGWMASQSHKENLLDTGYSDVGFGVARSPDYSAAGGGPMTIVVAFYGEPGNGSSSPGQVQGDASSSSISFAQLALAKLPVVGAATNLVVILAIGAIAFWIGRHFAALRKSIRKGQRFVLTHPLLDAGLLVIVVVSYLLTRTAGLIH